MSSYVYSYRTHNTKCYIELSLQVCLSN